MEVSHASKQKRGEAPKSGTKNGVTETKKQQKSRSRRDPEVRTKDETAAPVCAQEERDRRASQQVPAY